MSSGAETHPPPAAAALRGRTGVRFALDVLWRFGRPHTLIGTTLSVLALYVAVADATGRGSAFQLGCTLIAALCVNVFIVGVNQLTDVEIDRINKPSLPLAAGDLSRAGAWAICATCAVVPLTMGLTQGVLESAAVGAALLVGLAYSVEPVRLKRYPAVAAVCISGVRGAIVNLGVAVHFSRAFTDTTAVPDAVWALTAFILPFSFAIAILKDVPDVEGDRRYAIATFSVRFGGTAVLRLGLAVLAVSYVAMAVAGLWLDDVSAPLWVVAHLAALGWLAHRARGVDASDPRAFTPFYMAIWKLFFAEYALVALAALAG